MNFCSSICEKYPIQTGRHEATPSNARWMLRNSPTNGSLNQEDVRELKHFALQKG